jgi:cytochrome P450
MKTANTPIGYSTLFLQRREDIYPPTSEKFPHYLSFEPDRWDGWNPKMWTCEYAAIFNELQLTSNTDIPFNGGPRICIGKLLLVSQPMNTS